MTPTSMDSTKMPSFVLGAALATFTWTVRVPVPGDNDYVLAALPLCFQAVDQTELDRMQGLGLGPDEKQPTEAEICRRVVVGWPEMRDVQRNPVPFSPEALEQLMQAPMVRASIVACYLMAMSGMAARKNA